MQGERKTNTYFANAKLTELMQAITENVEMVSRALSQITRVHLFECFQCKSLIILISVFFCRFYEKLKFKIVLLTRCVTWKQDTFSLNVLLHIRFKSLFTNV